MGHNNESKIERAARLHGWLREQEAARDAVSIIEHFNARLEAGLPVLFWPTVGAALRTKHHWLLIACDSCGLMLDVDMTFKRRPADAPVSAALADVRCPRCNGHGRTRLTRLSQNPSPSSLLGEWRD